MSTQTIPAIEEIASIIKRALKVANRQVVRGSMEKAEYIRILGKATEFTYHNGEVALAQGLVDQLEAARRTLAFLKQEAHLRSSMR